MKYGRFLTIFGLMALMTTALNGCQSSTKVSDIYERYNTALASQTLPQSSTFAGSYLAGRFAQRQQDWNAAQHYLGHVLSEDDGNTRLKEKTFLLALGSGHHDRAFDFAKELYQDGLRSEVILIYLASHAIKSGDFNEAQNYLDHISSEGYGRYTKPLLKAWVHMGLGETEKAHHLLLQHTDKNDPTYRLHAGLMAELSGDMNGALEHYQVVMAKGLTLHTAVLISNFFDRYGQPEISRLIYEGLGKLYPFNPFVSSLNNKNSQRIVTENITHASQGASHVLFDLATLLYERSAYDSAQIYANIVNLMTPDSDFTLLMLGDIAALRQRYPEAVAAYNKVNPVSPIFWLSKMRIAEVYEINDDLDLAVDLLVRLSEFRATRVNALVTLGDIYRRNEKFDDALWAYDAALMDVEEITEDHWPVVYARGMALERLNKWQQAEKDLLKALEFQPNNPMILNYIGYSWADKGMHMEKALDFIRRAVEMRPQDGYILDSYGWAFYRMGRFDEAVKWLERAAQYIPDDPTILDHLGDAYFQAGRLNEAKFKWNHAIKTSRDKKFKTVLKHKIHHGIERKPPTMIVQQKEARL